MAKTLYDFYNEKQTDESKKIYPKSSTQSSSSSNSGNNSAPTLVDIYNSRTGSNKKLNINQSKSTSTKTTDRRSLALTKVRTNDQASKLINDYVKSAQTASRTGYIDRDQYEKQYKSLSSYLDDYGDEFDSNDLASLRAQLNNAYSVINNVKQQTAIPTDTEALKTGWSPSENPTSTDAYNLIHGNNVSGLARATNAIGSANRRVEDSVKSYYAGIGGDLGNYSDLQLRQLAGAANYYNNSGKQSEFAYGSEKFNGNYDDLTDRTEIYDKLIENGLSEDEAEQRTEEIMENRLNGNQTSSSTSSSQNPLKKADLFTDALSALQGELNSRDVKAKYNENTYNDDWDEASQYDESLGYSGDYDSTVQKALNNDSLFYSAVNGNQQAHNALGSVEGAYGSKVQYDTTVENYMTDDEVSMFNYLYKTQGSDAAMEYYSTLEKSLNARYAADQQAKTEAAMKDPATAVTANVVGTLVKPFTSIYNLAQNASDALTGTEIDPNDPKYAFGNLTNNIRTGTRNVIEDAAGGSDSTAGQWAGWGYDTFMSAVDNLYNMAIGASIAGAPTAADAAGKQAVERITLGIMGTEAGSDAFMQNIQSGMSQTDALIYGVASGGIEILTEKIGMDNLFDSVWTMGKTAWVSWAKQALAEGSEEVLGNTLDDAFDVMYSELKDQKSNIEKEVDQYVIDYGLAPNERDKAFSAVMQNHIQETALAGLSGAASAGAMAIPATISTDLYTRNIANARAEAVMNGLNIFNDMEPTDTVDAETVDDFANFVASIEGVTDKVKDSAAQLIQDAWNGAKVTVNDLKNLLASTYDRGQILEEQKARAEELSKAAEAAAKEAKEKSAESVENATESPVATQSSAFPMDTTEAATNTENSAKTSTAFPMNQTSDAETIQNNETEMADIIGSRFTGQTAEVFNDVINAAKEAGKSVVDAAKAFVSVYESENEGINTPVNTEILPETTQNEIRQQAILDSASNNVTSERAAAAAEVEEEITEEETEFIESLAAEYTEDYNMPAVAEAVKENYASGSDLYNYGEAVDSIVEQAKSGTSFSDIQLTKEQSRAIGSISARQAVYNAAVKEINNGRGEISVSGISNGNDVQNSGITRSGMAEETGRAEEAGSIISRSAEIAETHSLKYSEAVSPVQLGFSNGVETEKIRTVVSGSTSDTARAAEYASRFGLKANFFAGNSIVLNEGSGKPVRARGLIDGDNVWARVDHTQFNATQIIRHEAFHKYLATDKEAKMGNLMSGIEKLIGKKNLDIVKGWYLQEYDGSGLTADEVYEEMLCDFNGKMNVFSAKLTAAPAIAKGYNAILNAAGQIADNSIKAGTNSNGTSQQKLSRETDHIDSEELKDDVDEQKAIPSHAELQFSREFKDDLYNNAVTYNNRRGGVIAAAVLERAKAAQDYAAELLSKPAVVKLLPDESNVLSGTKDENGVKRTTLFGNASYGWSAENTTVCIRSLAMEDLLDRVAKRLGHSLTVGEAVAVSQMAWSVTDQPTCQYCYVWADRAAERAARGKYIEMRDEALKAIGEISADTPIATAEDLVTPTTNKSGKVIDTKFRITDAVKAHPELKAQFQVYKDFLGKRDNTINQRERFARFLDCAKNGKLMVTAADVATEADMAQALLDHPELKDEIEDIQRYASNASHAKKKVSYTAYNNDILKISEDTVKMMNENYGIRFYSYSDFHPAFILENMQMYTDAAVRKLKGLAYTKDLDYVRIFADTGANINISIKAIDKTTEMDGMQGADWEEAKKLRSQYKNVGIILVATDDAQVEWAMNQDWIDVIIPYHVCFSDEVGKIFGWKNYKAVQDDKKLRGLWKEGDLKHIAPPVHQNDFNKYIEACEKNHLKPRFDKWLVADDGTKGYKLGKTYSVENNPNYMKLVNETRQSEGETQFLQPKFNTKDVKRCIDDMVKRGGYNNPFGGSKENLEDLADEYAKRVQNGDNGRKFSREFDSDGNNLTEAQQEYFKDSKVRDENGNLKAMYHGTNQFGFTVFDPVKSNDKRSLFFTDKPAVARSYSNSDNNITVNTEGDVPTGAGNYKVYLNIKNPLIVDARNSNWNKIHYAPNASDVLKDVADFMDRIREWDMGIDIGDFIVSLGGLSKEVKYIRNDIAGSYDDDDEPFTSEALDQLEALAKKLDSAYNEWDENEHLDKDTGEPLSMYDYILYEYDDYKDSLKTTRQIAKEAKENGHDGVIFKNLIDIGPYSRNYEPATIAIAFDSNQVKSVSNQNPTGNADIRYSRETTAQTYEELEQTANDLRERVKNLEVDNRELERQKEYFKGQTQLSALTKGSAAYDKQTPLISEGSAKRMARDMIQRFGSTIKADEISGDIQKWVTYLASHKEANTYDKVCEGILPIAEKLVKTAQRIVDNDGSVIKKFIKSKTIRISPETIKDIQDYRQWRQSHFGRMTVSINKGDKISDVCDDLYNMFGNDFDFRGLPETDQVLAIANFVDSYSPITENPYSYDMANAIQSATYDVYNELLEAKIFKPTFADKAYADREALEKLTAKKIADIKQKAREDTFKRVQEAKDHAKQMAQNARDRRQDADLRKQLLKLAARATKLKTSNANKAAIRALIGDLDTTAVRLTEGKAQSLKDFVSWWDFQKKNNEDFFAHQKLYDAAIQRLNSKKIADLSISEVKTLIDGLTMMLKDIQTANKLIRTDDAREVRDMAREIMTDIDNSRGMTDGIHGAFDNVFVKGTLSPTRFTHRLTGYIDTDPLYKAVAGDDGLAGGQRKMLAYQMESGDLFKKWLSDKEFIKNITGSKAEVLSFNVNTTDKGPKTIKMTRAMRMSLYLHSLNEDSMQHMCGRWEAPSDKYPDGRYVPGGGFILPNMDTYKKGKLQSAYGQGYQQVRLKPSELRKLFTDMTEKERSFCKAISQYFNSTSQAALNDVSEELLGVSIAEVKNYFPINVDRDFLGADYGSIKMDGTIEGMGMLKERISSSKPIDIYDVNDVLKKSIESTSRYVGLAIPVRNINKLLSFSDGYVDENEVYHSYDNTVLKDISQKWGSKSKDYLNKMIQDMQSSGAQKEDLEKMVSKIRSGYAGAVLTWNLSVAMKQAASYPTAAAILGWEPLAYVMNPTNKNVWGHVDLELIKKYTPLQWYRTKGFSTAELGDIQNQNKFFANLPKALNWIQLVDVETTRKLWKASERYIQKNNKNLTVGTDNYYKAVANIYNQVIEETQPNYTALQRPEYLRSNSTVVQTLMMFKTQPFQNFNILYDGLFNYKAKSTQYKNGDISKAELNKAKTKLARAITSQVASMAVFAAMTLAWNIIRRKEEKYKDEDGWSLRVMSESMGKSMAEGAAGMIPFGSDIWELAESLIFGETYYGFESVTDSAIGDLLDSVSTAVTVFKTMAEDIGNGEFDFNSYKKNLKSVVSAVTKVAGVPFDNVYNLVTLTYEQSVAGITKLSGNEELGNWLITQWESDASSKKKAVTQNLFNAYNAEDTSKYESLRQTIINSGEFDADTIDSAMSDRYKESIGASTMSEVYDYLYSFYGTSDYDKEVETAEYFGIDEDKIQDGMKAAYARAVSGDSEATQAGAYQNLLDLYNSDKTAYNEEYEKMIELGYTDDAIQSGVEKILKEEQGVDSVKDLKERYYTPAQIEENKQKAAEEAAEKAAKAKKEAAEKAAKAAAEKAAEEAEKKKDQTSDVSSKSSWISSVTYNESTQTLTVNLKNGRQYVHTGVSSSVYSEMVNGDPGRVYNAYF